MVAGLNLVVLSRTALVPGVKRRADAVGSAISRDSCVRFSSEGRRYVWVPTEGVWLADYCGLDLADLRLVVCEPSKGCGQFWCLLV